MIINVSQGKQYHTQRNNKIKPLSTCNTTSMIMALNYSGVKLPSIPKDIQEEDHLTKFFNTDPRVATYYRTMAPLEYLKWAHNKPDAIPPNEYHAVLCYGTNLWLGHIVVSFSVKTKMSIILGDLLKGKAVIQTGLFAGLRHIICVVGFETSQDNILAITDPEDIDIGLISNILIDDPYGDLRTEYKSDKGDDVPIPFKGFIHMSRDFDSLETKWAHRIT